jgi:hypothetical protein
MEPEKARFQAGEQVIQIGFRKVYLVHFCQGENSSGTSWKESWLKNSKVALWIHEIFKTIHKLQILPLLPLKAPKAIFRRAGMAALAAAYSRTGGLRNIKWT